MDKKIKKDKHVRRKYVPPQVMSLGNINSAIGACVSGSGDSGNCESGVSALQNCELGNIAQGINCENGNSPGNHCENGIGGFAKMNYR